MMPKMLPGLRLTNNGNTIEAVGPIHWNPQNPATPPKEIAAVFAVVVSQVKPNGGVAMAIGWSESTFRTSPIGTRMPTSSPRHGPFSGGATVAAWATVAHDDGGYGSYQWTLPTC